MSSSIPIFALSLPVLLVAVPMLIAGVILVILVMLGNKAAHDHRRASQLSDEETRLLQDIARSLDKMDRRIENLETIVHGGVNKS